ncbi:hypothetical protein D3C78_1640210 [compost metagenome]
MPVLLLLPLLLAGELLVLFLAAAVLFLPASFRLMALPFLVVALALVLLAALFLPLLVAVVAVPGKHADRGKQEEQGKQATRTADAHVHGCTGRNQGRRVWEICCQN